MGCIRIELYNPTQNGDEEIVLFNNLGKNKMKARLSIVNCIVAGEVLSRRLVR
ncbi:MAG: hypothetical protein LBT09_06690 [Planctomycetaceae bacterium]|jgi:hypothetical protein|nr:hypothetical protein [Planctomycetaceae bacterium]